MNARQLLTAVAVAVAATGAFAAEGTQWTPPAGTLTRAEVRAELARAVAAGEVAAVSAAYGDPIVALVKAPDAPTLSREAVRAAARQPAAANGLYVGG